MAGCYERGNESSRFFPTLSDSGLSRLLNPSSLVERLSY
jgi:hypothetical protein